MKQTMPSTSRITTAVEVAVIIMIVDWSILSLLSSAHELNANWKGNA